MTARRQLETLALGREADSGRRPLAGGQDRPLTHIRPRKATSPGSPPALGD